MPNLNLDTPVKPTWCPGCGNFGVLAAFKQACLKENWNNSNTALVAGIGCHGHVLNFIRLTSFEGLHGRAIPVATGIKLANNRLNVFVFTGDGDCLGEGGNHFIHACRRNHDLTVILHDNALYSLTTGQTSPTSPHGAKTKSTPLGNIDNPFSPITLAIASGATFVARALSNDVEKLSELITKANAHQGLSIIDVLQPCVSFNKEYTSDFYKDNFYYLDESYDVTNKEVAFTKSQEWGIKQIPLGIFYNIEKPSYESQIPQIKDKPLVDLVSDRKNLEDLFKKYT